MIKRLDDEARAALPQLLPHWRLHEARDALVRSFRFTGFDEAWRFMTGVAALAQEQDHHPEWSNVYNRVEILLTTHAAHGLSTRDIRLATAIDALPETDGEPRRP